MRPATRLFTQATKVPLIRTGQPPYPPKAIFDTLSASRSHLLNVTLADALPRHCQPSWFQEALGIDDAEVHNSHGSGWRPSGYELRCPPDSALLPMPLGHHSIFFPPQIRPSRLTADGTDPDHALPPPFVRRMWAGGSIEFADGWEHRMRMDGRRAVCVETVGEPRERGNMRFVEVERKYGPVPRARISGEVSEQDEVDMKGIGMVTETPQITEVRRLVFLPHSPPEHQGSQKSPPKREVLPREFPGGIPDDFFDLVPDEHLLFHFSALTFNAHAIHLDPEFAQQEGHRGILFHGPLSLTLMLSLLQGQAWVRDGWRLRNINYRNVDRLYVGERLTVCVNLRPQSNERERLLDVWIQGPTNRIAVKGRALFVNQGSKEVTSPDILSSMQDTKSYITDGGVV